MADTFERCLVIGAAGFIGQNMLRCLESRRLVVTAAYRHTSLEELSASEFDCVFFCAGNSKTYLTNREPVTCLNESVAALYDYMTSLTYAKWVLISSSTVYPQERDQKVESAPIPVHEVSLYGAHKLLAERYVAQFAPNWIVLRPTGFFGPGLKKNLLFDVRAGQQDVYLKRESRIDYLPIERFCDIAATLAERVDRDIVNIGSGFCLSVDEILEMRPNEYVFHEERLQDDTALSLDKMRGLCADDLDGDELRRLVRSFVLS